MARTETIIGGIAAVVAVAGFAVFGYRAMTADDAPDAHGARGGGHRRGAGADDDSPPLEGLVARRRTEVIDADYKFKLTAPGPAWEALDREAADATLLGKLAALVSEHARIEVVVERIGDLPIATAAPYAANYLADTVEYREPLRWLDRDAYELRSVDRPALATRMRAFVRDGLLYMVTIQRGAGATWDQLDLDAIWGGFATLPGTAHARTPDFAPTDLAGVGWRVRGRTWESAVNGITVTAPPGWRLVTGPAAGGALIDVALTNDACACTITMASTAIAPHTDVQPRTISVEMLGQSYLLYAAEPDALGIRQTWNNLIDFDHGLVIRFIASYPKADATTGILELRRALAEFKPLPADDHRRLVEALARDPYQQTAIGPTWAVRGGAYASYEWGVTWHHPGGYWRVSAGPEVANAEPGSIFIATEAQLGFSLVVVPDDGLLGAGASIRASMKGLVGKPVRVPALPGALTDGWELRWKDTDGIAQVYQVAALIGNRHAFRIQWSGEAAVVEAARDRLDAALTAFAERTDLAPADAQPYVDRRWGYRMDLPAAWAMTDRGDDSSYTGKTWQADDTELIGVAIYTFHDGVAGAATSWWMRIAASAAVALGTAPQPHRSAGDLAGEPAQVLRWYEGTTLVTVYLAERGDVAFAVYARGTAATAERARAAFDWVPRPD